MTEEYTTIGLIESAIDILHSQTKMDWTANRIHERIPEIKDSLSARTSLIEWYNDFKKEQISEFGNNIAHFMALELESRFPFLKDMGK